MHKRFRNSLLKLMILFPGLLLLTACQADPSTETDPETLQTNGSEKDSLSTSLDIEDRLACPLNELLDYLQEAGAGIPYAYAQILITVNDQTEGQSADSPETSDGEFRQDIIELDGTADITWQTFETEEAFQDYFTAQEHTEAVLSREGSVYEAAFSYYQYQLAEDIHALTIDRFLKEHYDREDNLLYAITISNRQDASAYCFSQAGERELLVMDNTLYGLECQNSTDQISEEDIHALLMAYTTHNFKVKEYNGWVMEEEALYWFDHDERVTRLDDPTRVFTEVRGKNDTLEDELDMKNFAMLKEADYQIRLFEEGPLLRLHFSFAGEIPPDGYRVYLFNGSCTEEDYEMTVTNQDTNELLQSRTVPMSIELPDMISFIDLNQDGYLDMQIGYPTHWNGSKAEMDEYASSAYMLWNPEENLFEDKSEKDIAQSLLQNQGQTASTEYVVRPGDTLWGISRRFYGTGTRYTEIEAQNADMLSGCRYLMPGMVLEIPEFP